MIHTAFRRAAATTVAVLAAVFVVAAGPAATGVGTATAGPVPPGDHALVGATAQAADGRCGGPEVVLVHDLAGTAADWDPLAGDLLAAGWCPVAIDWGRPRQGDVPLPVGGLTGVEAGAAEVARVGGWGAGAATVPVVARGVGGLAVQRALQRLAPGPGPGPVSTLITLGPLWNGTNAWGIADVEDVSRALGTFEAVLAWERTWMDPICEGCREAVRGSDLLARMHHDGIRTPGVTYTDIVSAGDLLAHPPLAQSPPGTEVRVLGPPGEGTPVWHGELGRDPGSRRLVMEVLGPP